MDGRLIGKIFGVLDLYVFLGFAQFWAMFFSPKKEFREKTYLKIGSDQAEQGSMLTPTIESFHGFDQQLIYFVLANQI